MDRRTSGIRRAPKRSAGDRRDRERACRRLGRILPLPPKGDDLELGYRLAPWAWGRGLAAEAGHALAHYAFSNGEEEVFAVARPKNDRGTHAARRIGMEWVGETEKY
jgi:RimJ/RimL family protein N-acetyltransferase